jgi:hypothetical protein
MFTITVCIQSFPDFFQTKFDVTFFAYFRATSQSIQLFEFFTDMEQDSEKVMRNKIAGCFQRLSGLKYLRDEYTSFRYSI